MRATMRRKWGMRPDQRRTMRVSELVKMLQRYQAKHGDQEVEDVYGDKITEPEEIDGVCILADKA